MRGRGAHARLVTGELADHGLERLRVALPEHRPGGLAVVVAGDEAIRERPRAVWLDARETLALRLEQLFDDFPDRQGHPAEIAVRADEEPVEHVTASQLTTRIVDGRGREEASWRVARQEIADGDS